MGRGAMTPLEARMTSERFAVTFCEATVHAHFHQFFPLPLPLPPPPLHSYHASLSNAMLAYLRLT